MVVNIKDVELVQKGTIPIRETRGSSGNGYRYQHWENFYVWTRLGTRYGTTPMMHTVMLDLCKVKSPCAGRSGLMGDILAIKLV